MPSPSEWDEIERAIRQAIGLDFVIADVRSVGGGSINEAYRVQGSDGSRYFVKLNAARQLPMFVAETQGLQALAATQTLRVPRPIASGSTERRSYLVLEHLEMRNRGEGCRLGEQLAGLHRCTARRHGFAHDNFIGTTPQSNAQTTDWPVFLREHRLGCQLRLAAANGYRGKLQQLGAELLARLPVFFDGYAPQPSLLHGDLWSGNHGFLGDGTPVVFDPAAYYGDRECDLAMTELFGGYPHEFYAAYRAAWPLDPGYAVRKDLYNLYHLLNHANLFGSGYAAQAEQMIGKLLAEC